MGLFSAVLAPEVGATGSVVVVESAGEATRDATRNLREHPQARVETGRVERVLPRLGRADLVVLDPPRLGPGRTSCRMIVDSKARVVSYVACDPASLARDTAILAALGYDLTDIRAFDLFPMTHHVGVCRTIRTSMNQSLRPLNWKSSRPRL